MPSSQESKKTYFECSYTDIIMRETGRNKGNEINKQSNVEKVYHLCELFFESLNLSLVFIDFFIGSSSAGIFRVPVRAPRTSLPTPLSVT